MVGRFAYEVRNGEAAKHHDRREEHRLVTNGLDKRIKDLRKRVGRNLRSGHFIRIPRLAPPPLHTIRLDEGRPLLHGLALVVRIILRALRDIAHDLRHCFVGFLVDVAHDRRPEGVDNVATAAEEEDVEEELGVVG